MSRSRCAKYGKIFDTDEELESDKDGNVFVMIVMSMEGGMNV
ncbi:MAG: hypothetical protein UX65_C0010G0024 [Parcubacteria group bacterium GW2011_GWB1_46_8]|nr:MAG: hypothetical protein UX65_C0010G0024 [Parcubacteria group bacterium GW2011_GWB1_46_8]